QTPSSVRISSSASIVALGASVTLTATVTPSAASGTVTFKDLNIGAALGTANVGSGGVALLTTSSLKAGLRSIVAIYGGDTNNQPSGSPVFYQEVTPTAGVTFRSDYANPIPVGATPVSTATGDFNGDGIPDLAIACDGGTLGVTTYAPFLYVL